MTAFAVPELVRQRAVSSGGIGTTWLTELPEIVRVLAERWDLRIGHALDGGTASLVLRATRSTGDPCVLKVAMPADDAMVDSFERSATVHRIANGRGCAALLAVDQDHRALLLEHLGPNLHELGMSTDHILDTVVDTLVQFWRPAPAGVDLPTAADQGEWLGAFVVDAWDALGAPCPRVVIDRALDCVARRVDAFRMEGSLVVHGDAHGWNTLQAGPSGFKFVDPEGLVSSREHDLAIPMREYNQPLLGGDTPRLVHERAERLADRCDADAEAIWEWGFVERVSTGLANLRDFDAGGPEFLLVAERCV